MRLNHIVNDVKYSIIWHPLIQFSGSIETFFYLSLYHWMSHIKGHLICICFLAQNPRNCVFFGNIEFYIIILS